MKAQLGSKKPVHYVGSLLENRYAYKTHFVGFSPVIQVNDFGSPKNDGTQEVVYMSIPVYSVVINYFQFFLN